MTAEDLIKNNSLTDIEVTGNQTIVFSEIALTAVNMAREEVKCTWEKAMAAFVKDAEEKKIQKAIKAHIETCPCICMVKETGKDGRCLKCWHTTTFIDELNK